MDEGTRRVIDPRAPDQALFDLMVHLETVHLYDFGDTAVDPEHDGYAIDELHEELHRRSDYGRHRHAVNSHERSGA